jgi:hypothetical protein
MDGIYKFIVFSWCLEKALPVTLQQFMTFVYEFTWGDVLLCDGTDLAA